MSTSHISQALHQDHEATVAFTERLETLLARHPRQPPDAADPLVAKLLRDLPAMLDTEISRHFDFEEAELFRHLAEAGEEDIGTHLSEEHDAMRPLGRRLIELIGPALVQGFDDAGWKEFRTVGAELCERMVMHVQKEEMVLLPLIETSLDAETDASLYADYMGNN
ncbi:MAG: hemerythrin domain-containing protein [Gammaproteobacteria bacterium]|nr:hemerythrin domain-containing protein [Gammaproteobacteria bacterium]